VNERPGTAGPLAAPLAGPRCAPGRAATAQRQAWQTLRLAFGFVMGAAIAAVSLGRAELWVALHLFLLGGLLMAISATTQMFAVTWSSSPAPPDRLVAAQRWSLAVGALGVVTARGFSAPVALLAASGTLVLGSLVLLAVILVGVRQRAVTDRYHAAIDCYLLAIAVGVVGSTVGILVGTGSASTAPGARNAHIVANLFGLIGLVVLGTLPTFIATQVRTKVSPRLTPRRLRSVGGLMAMGTFLAATGALVEVGAIGAAGFLAYLLAVGGVVALLPRLGPRQRSWAGPRLVLLLVALAWWGGVAGWSVTIEAGWAAPTDRRWAVLAIGAYAQLVVGALAYLGPIIRGRDHLGQQRAFAITRSWTAVIAVNAAAVACALGWWSVAAVAVAALAADVAIRAARLVRQVVPTPLPSRG
jgi:nitrite reductase (NO-forming)